VKKELFNSIESYMLECMRDSAHDKEHIYRVLYLAFDIAKYERNVDMDILIAACLLHDIGRTEQFINPNLCHAKIGGEKAYIYLIESGWSRPEAEYVKNCIITHRFRSDNPPRSTVAKILFDSDKLDVAGTLGIARTLLYKGKVSEPIYTTDESHNILDGTNDEDPSFFKEYKYKLEKVYDKFYTKRGSQIAKDRQESAIAFYNSMLKDVKSCYSNGIDELSKILE